MTTNIAPDPVLHFTDNNGNLLSGGKLFTYAAGTTTKLTTYTDSTGSTPNTNPIILNTRGECNCWLTAGVAYKFTLSPSTDSDPPTNSFWTVDQITSSGAAGSFSSLAVSGAGSFGSISAGTATLTTVTATQVNATNLAVSNSATGVTPAQTDNSTKFATTAWVRGLGPVYAGVTSLTSGTALTAANLGYLLVINAGTANTQSLPAASGCPAGSQMSFFSIGAGAVAVQCSGTDVIYAGLSNPTAITLNQGDTLTLVSNGTNGWEAVDGSAQLQYSNSFFSHQTGNGHLDLPGGLILNWGSGVSTTNAANNCVATYDKPFKTGTLIAFMTPVGAFTNTLTLGVGTCSTTQFVGSAAVAFAYSASVYFNYLAIGV